MLFIKKSFIKLLLLFFPIAVFAQAATEKQVTIKNQTWTAINSSVRFNDHWGTYADFQVRSNGFFDQNNFILARVGANYFLHPQVILSAGYDHQWNAPTVPGWRTYADENRIVQQVQFNSTSGGVEIQQRIRNEQRWVEKIVNDAETAQNRFTDRVRYLLGFNIPIFKNNKLPRLVIADEIMFQFGKEIVYNTFDQNNFFIGLRQNLTRDLSCDLGYMNLFQQKYSGYQYDMTHTLRIFFYYNPDFRKRKP